MVLLQIKILCVFDCVLHRLNTQRLVNTGSSSQNHLSRKHYPENRIFRKPVSKKILYPEIPYLENGVYRKRQ